ncbi:MAG: spore coat associated protein CotJA [Anaerotignum sp.]
MKEMCENFVTDTVIPNNIMAKYAPIIDDTMELAQAYIPLQPYTTTMSQSQSLVCGTTFNDLVVPYCAGWHLYQLSREV